jgi:hypothetical protein
MSPIICRESCVHLCRNSPGHALQIVDSFVLIYDSLITQLPANNAQCLFAGLSILLL